MKKFFLLLLTLGCTLIIAACSSQYCKPQTSPNFLKETWMGRINTNPNNWLYGADRWFLTGNPIVLSEYVRGEPYSNAITAVEVRVPNFTKLEVDGPFQIQMVYTPYQNKVAMVGPNEQTRQVSIAVRGDTLVIRASDFAIKNKMPLNKVVIRIAIRQLHALTNWGTCSIYGRNIISNHLVINSYGSGKILLQGRMNVASITQFNNSEITILGAYTPSLYICVENATLNIYGRVGVHTIKNKNGQINIIGVDTNSLDIDAMGKSCTLLSGYANVKRITAMNDSEVYLYWVNSYALRVQLKHNARVGLAGCTRTLNITAANNSRFYGKYLRSINAYVTTRDYAHVNVSASHHIFASASNASSIYFFGSREILSPYIYGNAKIIPIEIDPSEPLPFNQYRTSALRGTWATVQ